MEKEGNRVRGQGKKAKRENEERKRRQEREKPAAVSEVPQGRCGSAL